VGPWGKAPLEAANKYFFAFTADFFPTRQIGVLPAVAGVTLVRGHMIRDYSIVPPRYSARFATARSRTSKLHVTIGSRYRDFHYVMPALYLACGGVVGYPCEVHQCV
jgi:hypothetical protein